MTTLYQRDVVLIQVPFSTQVRSKPRPVIVVSNDNYNKNFQDFIAIPLTSKNLVSRDHTVRITNKEMEEGRLIVDSTAKVDRVSSLHQKLVIQKIGRIKKQTFTDLRNSFVELI